MKLKLIDEKLFAIAPVPVLEEAIPLLTLMLFTNVEESYVTTTKLHWFRVIGRFTLTVCEGVPPCK